MGELICGVLRMKALYVTIANLEFTGMTPDEAEAIVMEILGMFKNYCGSKTQAIATDHPHNVEMIDTSPPEGPILHKEVRDQ